MTPEIIQLRLELAVKRYVQECGEKPALLQISRDDYKKLLPCQSETARFGLCIRGVTTVGLEDIEPGKYFLVN